MDTELGDGLGARESWRSASWELSSQAGLLELSTENFCLRPADIEFGWGLAARSGSEAGMVPFCWFSAARYISTLVMGALRAWNVGIKSIGLGVALRRSSSDWSLPSDIRLLSSILLILALRLSRLRFTRALTTKMNSMKTAKAMMIGSQLNAAAICSSADPISTVAPPTLSVVGEVASSSELVSNIWELGSGVTTIPAVASPCEPVFVVEVLVVAVVEAVVVVGGVVLVWTVGLGVSVVIAVGLDVVTVVHTVLELVASVVSVWAVGVDEVVAIAVGLVELDMVTAVDTVLELVASVVSVWAVRVDEVVAIAVGVVACVVWVWAVVAGVVVAMAVWLVGGLELAAVVDAVLIPGDSTHSPLWLTPAALHCRHSRAVAPWQPSHSEWHARQNCIK